ncbi:hypothetical protein [Nonomuraea solani]|uniref:hypothetical protein n=1 Tax=Nonomuraea solani TaxID=1144553 RepID=UPI0011AFEB8F|nr:hypothetical protein [Nonomuraea solani]
MGTRRWLAWAHSLRSDGALGDPSVAPANVAAALCARAGRSLTRSDWTRLIPGAHYRRIC